MEDKKEIVMLLKHLLRATRAGADIEKMELSGNGETVRVTFEGGCEIAIIRDVAAGIS